MPQPNWHMRHWETGRPMTLMEAFGFSKFALKFPEFKPELPGAVASSSGTRGSGGGSGTPQSNVGSGSTNFAKGVLTGIGAPITAANIRSIILWIHREGGGGTNNPLNTTEKEPGSTDFNSVDVQNYRSATQGVNATITTLENGNYNDIVSALHSGKGLMGRSFTGLSTWSGGGYNTVG
jgi:hypothetical protein